MTCIAAVIKRGGIYMAADSGVRLYSNETDISGKGSSKIFTKHLGGKTRILIGSAGDAFAMQVLQYKCELPAAPKGRGVGIMMQWFAEEYVSAVRHALTLDGCMVPSKEGSPAVRCMQLVGIRGRLYTITSSLAVIPCVEDYSAIGSGGSHALASLYTSKLYEKQPKKRLKIALSAAERWVSDVCGPFDYKTI